MFADVPQIVVSGEALVTAATIIAGGLVGGIKWAASTITGYLRSRDGTEERCITALVEVKAAMQQQGEALSELVRQVRDYSHDVNELANVAGLKTELERIKAERRAKDEARAMEQRT